MTIHNLGGIKCHGHLSSHNIMIDLSRLESGNYRMKVRLADLENLDFMQYANLFYDYRLASVSSAPEVLKQPKKISQDLMPAMDVYSFGFILWEIWHC